MNPSPPEIQPTGATIVWPRSGGALTASAAKKPGPREGPALPDSPAGEIERILREYACECYAVGRGESMYYLVEDLPRLAQAATQEVLAVRPRGLGDRWKAGLGIQGRLGTGLGATAPTFDPLLHPSGVPPASVAHALQATAKRGARSVVAVLPVLTVLAALGLTIVLAVAGL